MIARIYAVGEVDAMLPLVAAIVAEVVERAAALRARGCAVPLPRSGASLPMDMVPAGEQGHVLDLRRCVRELEDLGAYLRDAERGLVEWYGEVDSDIAYLSWMPGETRIRHWRGLYSRAASRRALTPTEVVSAV